MRIAIYLFLFLSVNVLGQIGSLRVEDIQSDITHDTNPNLLDVIAIQIFHNDTTAILDSIVKRGFEIELDSISCGKYSTKLFINGELCSINYFTVNANSISFIEVNSDYKYAWELPYSRTFSDTTPKKSIIQSELFASYGRGFLEDKNYPIKNKFSLGYNTIYGFKICNHFSVGFNLGFLLSHAYFDKDSPQTPGNHIYERYFQLNGNIGPYLRLSQKSMIDKSTYKSIYIDLGINYALPLVSHYTIKDKNVKTIKSGLHQYTNCFVYSRLGFNNISILVQYRLLDYLKGSYVELPKLEFGISFFIQSWTPDL